MAPAPRILRDDLGLAGDKEYKYYGELFDNIRGRVIDSTNPDPLNRSSLCAVISPGDYCSYTVVRVYVPKPQLAASGPASRSANETSVAIALAGSQSSLGSGTSSQGRDKLIYRYWVDGNAPSSDTNTGARSFNTNLNLNLDCNAHTVTVELRNGYPQVPNVNPVSKTVNVPACAKSVTIQGRVWYDEDRNGTQDGYIKRPFISCSGLDVGHVITLNTGQSAYLDGCDAAGATYQFTGLPLADYTITLGGLSGWHLLSTNPVTVTKAEFEAKNYVADVWFAVQKDAPPPPGSFTLSVSKDGTGSGTVTSAPAGINCGVTCSANFTDGTSVALTASAASGSTFGGWSGACSGTGGCSVTMNANKTATATFTKTGGGGSLEVTLTASPFSGTGTINSTLSASVNTASSSGTPVPPYTYSFDCTSDGTYEHVSAPTNSNPYSFSTCTYSSSSTAKVDVADSAGQRGSATTPITIGAPQPQGDTCPQNSSDPDNPYEAPRDKYSACVFSNTTLSPGSTSPLGVFDNQYAGYFEETPLAPPPSGRVRHDYGNGKPKCGTTGAPAPTNDCNGNDNFSIRWMGNFSFNRGQYRFTARADDGVRLYVDGTRIIDAWRDQPPTTYTADRALSAGYHAVQVEYYEKGGGAYIEFYWELLPCTTVVNGDKAVVTSDLGTVGTALNPGGIAWNAGDPIPREVALTMRNCGDTTWQAANHYRLGATNDVTIWGAGRVRMSSADSWGGTVSNKTPKDTVAPNESITFTFDVTAPSEDAVKNGRDSSGAKICTKQSGNTYNCNFRYQMLHEAVAWFPDIAAATVKVVIDPCSRSYPRDSWQACIYNKSPFNDFDAAFFHKEISDAVPKTNAYPAPPPRKIYHDWGESGPLGPATTNSGPPFYLTEETGNPVDDFSVRWRGKFKFDSAEYQFAACSDDGIRIYVDGEAASNRILEDWRPRACDDPSGSSGRVTANKVLAAGDHQIMVEYFESSGQAVIDVYWEKVTVLAPIADPTAAPFCSGSDSKATISWSEAGRGSAGYFVDIDNDNNWNNGFWNKNIPSGTLSTTAPDGFNGYNGPSGPMPPLQAGATYQVRIFYIATGEHSSTVSFKASTCTGTFTINVAPATRTITQGDATTYNVNVSCSGSFAGPVTNLNVTNLHTNTNPSFNPTSINCSGPGGNSTLTITTSAATQTGTKTLNVNGDGAGAGTQTGNADLTVNALEPPEEPCVNNCTPPPPTGGCSGTNCTNPPPGLGGQLGVAVSCEQILFAWQDRSDNEDGFHVWRAPSFGGTTLTYEGRTYSLLGTKGANVEYHLDTTALPDQSYWYAVTSYNAGGDSAADGLGPIFNTACAANLSLSDKVIDSVNGSPYVVGQSIKNGDTVRFRIIINNSGNTAAYDVYVDDTISSNLQYTGNPTIQRGSGSESGISVSQNGQNLIFDAGRNLGDKDADSQNWLVRFNVLVNSASSQAVDFMQNSAKIYYAKTNGGAQNQSVNVDTGLVPLRTGKAKIPSIKEIAP